MSANPQLTGVWQAWDIKVSPAPSPSDYEKTARDAKFLDWLTSGPDRAATRLTTFAALPSTAPVTLWGKGTLGEVLAASGLAYHLRIGTTPGRSDLLAPMAAANGLARAEALQPSRSRLLTGLPLGQPIYWSVQAADTGFAASPFTAEQ